MDVDRTAIGAVLATALALATASGCGGADGEERPDGGERPGRVSIGGARLAADEGGRDLIRGPSSPRGAPEAEPPARSDDPGVAVGSEGRRCSGGELEPVRENLGQLADATLCLLNAERTMRGLRPLSRNGRLDRAALAHSRDMVRRSYFAHDSPSGATFLDRIRRARYLSGSRGWLVGENLAWGSGRESTPREIVDAWMRSPPHRANVLQGRFREIGIGVAPGAPVSSSRPPAATYNTDFGARRKPR